MLNRIIFIGIISLGVTIFSPFIFYSYYETQPKLLEQKVLFGGPLPFAEQQITLPADDNKYPLEVKFTSPFEKQTTFKAIPLLISFVCYFLFLFALYSIIARFFHRLPAKEPK